jgi:hypothetical protein
MELIGELVIEFLIIQGKVLYLINVLTLVESAIEV